VKSFNPKSVEHYRKLGFHAATVDKWNAHDLFGFADVLAFSNDLVILCQATSLSNLASRIRKAISIEAAQAWVDNKHRALEFHGWYKVGRRWHVKVKTLRFSRNSTQ
jgi:hypothetical protein